MEKNTDVRAKLQVAGVFWDAKDPQSQFSGALSCDGKRIELLSSAELVATDARLVNALLNGTLSSAPDVVHGFTTEGDCTLLGLQEISNPSHAELTTNRAVVLRKFRIWACVFGALLEHETAPQIDEAVFIYSGLADWLPGVGTVSWTADSVEMKYPTKLQTILDLSFQDQVRIRLEVAPGFQLRRGPVRHIGRTAPHLARGA